MIYEEIKINHKKLKESNFIVIFIHIRHLKICPHTLFFFMETGLGKISKGERGSFVLTAGRVFLTLEAAQETCTEKNCLEHNCRVMTTL